MESFQKILLVGIVVLLVGCDQVVSNSDEDEQTTEEKEWLIPEEEVFNAGSGIPSIDDPKFKPTNEIEYVDDDRLIIGVRIGNTVKGYPHQVMDYHEIVNDQINDTPFCLTYCPLTGTGIAWDRTIDGEAAEFGVSGLLFRNNLIAYDRTTRTHYSQMQMRAVNGPRKGQEMETFQVIQTKWSTWKQMFPDAQVLTTETGHSRNYNGFAYGERYLELDTPPLFPIDLDDEKLSFAYKKRLYGIIENDADIESAGRELIDISNFDSGIELQEAELRGTNFILAGSSGFDFTVAFEKELDGTELNFTPVQNNLPVIMEDQEGNQWDVFGYAVEGPRQGGNLVPALAYYGYAFAWVDFFRD